MAKLYESHQDALRTLFGDVENYSRTQKVIFTGTPGSVLIRKNSGGFEFYSHQYYDPNGKKIEQYLAGPVGNPEAEAKAESFRERTHSLSEVTKNIRLLGREGFKIVDSKTFATAAALHNNGLFQAGAVMVGSHAFGALLNHLGARAAQYVTKDVDIARGAELDFITPPKASFLEMLKESGIAFVEVPQLNNRMPSTSFKEAGKSLFQVDLLVPSRTNEIHTIRVPELQAHATALPYLKYLLGADQEATIIGKEGCCRIRVPTPERFALHKLIVSQLRNRSEKVGKDISQAAVLFAILSEQHPGAIEDAARAIPKSARKFARHAYLSAREQLDSHPRAIESLDAIFGTAGKREDETEIDSREHAISKRPK